MRCRRVLLAVNVSRGTNGAVRRKISLSDCAPKGMERVCGTHAVLAILDVYAREQSRGATSPFVDGRDALRHPSRRSGVAPRLFVRNFRYDAKARMAGGGGDGMEMAMRSESDGAPARVAATAADDSVFMPDDSRPYKNFRKIVQLARALKISVIPVERNALTNLCGERRNQNIVLEVGSYEPRPLVQLPTNGGGVSAVTTADGGCKWTMPTASPNGDGSVYLFLDHIIDPMNLGNMLRTAFFFGIRNVVLSADCSRCLPSVARCSTGALEWLQIGRVAAGTSTEAFLKRTVQGQSNAWMVVGATASRPTSTTTASSPTASPRGGGSSPLQQRSPSTNLVVLLGNEDAGLSAEVLRLCTHVVHIPSRGDASDGGSSNRGVSLNVNSACAILLAHVAGVVPVAMKQQDQP